MERILIESRIFKNSCGVWILIGILILRNLRSEWSFIEARAFRNFYSAWILIDTWFQKFLQQINSDFLEIIDTWLEHAGVLVRR